jgi:ESCRT-II complex subunit VPS22
LHVRKGRQTPSDWLKFNSRYLYLANKGFWADLLGFGDFYFELGVQITEICIATRSQNGGLIEIGELKRRIKAMRGITGETKATQQEISE